MKDAVTATAVIGMAGRFPQTPNIDAFWAACRDGVDCVSRWDGWGDEGRVFAGGLVADQELFDPAAFGISPTEAEILDPQHRVFLELCWQGLAHASVVPEKSRPVSVYASASPSRYQPAGTDGGSENVRYQRMIANSPDFLATRVSYHLDLCGEAVNVQTACSSSLVAVHLACLSLQSGRSDIAIAGGVSIDPEQERGYIYEAGMISSPDGICLPFEADARGAVPGNGAAVVVLQRLSDALAERRPVHAIIRATSTNNDGRAKSSFMAPNVEGQSEVIATALATAGVPADSIEFLEAHGTATRLGDSIEIEAAQRAFRHFTNRRSFCALGSLKANFGHMDRSAGVAGLIKAILAVREGVIPPLVGFRRANPDLDLSASPFRVPTTSERWSSNPVRRAGVSSFGVGGTNVHVIVEEFQGLTTSALRMVDPGRPLVLPLSAHSETALADIRRQLAAACEQNPVTLDLVHTLATGCVERPIRTVVVAPPERARDALLDLRSSTTVALSSGSLAVLFPGQGAEVGYEAHGMMERYEIFRNEINAFAFALGVSPEQLLDGVRGTNPSYRTFAYQPALVAVQVALARLVEYFGVVGAAVCGNSVGEYAAAYMAGVFDRRGLMTVLAARDHAMRAAPEGRMLTVLSSAQDVVPLLAQDVDLAGETGRDRVMLSGSPDAICRQQAILEEREIMARVLPGCVAPHGRLMAGVADELRKAFDGVRLTHASHPIISTLTGGWADLDQIADPEHWVRHLCEPFKLQQAFATLADSGFDRFVEASPGGALTNLVRTDGARIGVTLGGEPDTDPTTSLLTAMGELWCSGTRIDWDAVNSSADADFTTLPPYPFQRARFWSHRASHCTEGFNAGDRRGHLERPVWCPQPGINAPLEETLPGHVIVNGDGPLATALIERLETFGCGVKPSKDIRSQKGAEDAVLIDVSHADPRCTALDEPMDAVALCDWLESGFLRLIDVLQSVRPSKLLIVTRELWPVVPGDRPTTASAGVIGIARCAPHDWPGLQTRIVDLSPDGGIAADIGALMTELASAENHDVAYRGNVRYRRRYESVTPSGSGHLRRGGTYLVLGGTGRLGAVVAEAISREVEATVVLVGRDPRRPASPEAERLIARATANGCEVLTRAACSDDRAQLRGLLDDLTARYGRVDGVFHLAANTDTATFPFLGKTTPEAAYAIAGAKVNTAALLADEFAGHDYDFVALFSSISTVIGATRFGVYVAANAYLDSLAVRMVERTGRAWYSLVWDGWSADGIATPNGLGSGDGADLLLRALRTEYAVVAPVVKPLDLRITAVQADLAIVARAGRDATAASGSPTEHVMQVVTDVTGYTEIDPRQNFASLGIDSLRLMQIAVRLQSLLGESVNIGRLLAATSVEELSELATEAMGDRDAKRAAPTVGEQDLSTPQERLWYLSQLDPGSSCYNVPFGWLVPSTVREGVRDAVLSVLDRHEVLRCAYQSDVDGRPVRTVLRAQEVPVTECALDPADPDAAFEQIAREFVESPFDLTRGSTRVLIAFGRDGTRLLFVCHHISVDAWSIKLLRDELFRRLLGNQGPAATPRARYSDFVRWEYEMRDGSQYERLVQYWRETLRNAQPTLPPADKTTAQTGERPVGRATAVLPRERLDALRALLREEGTTLYAAGLTGLSIALCKWCGLGEVVIGTNLANRMREQFESVVGMFVDPVVLRLAPGLEDPATTLGDALATVRERLTATIANSSIPYWDVVRLCGRRDTAGENPVFSIIATMFDMEDSATDFIPLNIPLPTTSKFALAVEFLPRQDGLLVHVLYDADRYLPATIDRLLERILRYLESLTDGGIDMPLASLIVEKAAMPARERFAQRFSRLRGVPAGSGS